MPNLIITDCDIGSVPLEVTGTLDGILENSAVTAETFLPGTLLARGVDGHFYPYDPGDVALDTPVYVLTYEVIVPGASEASVTVMTAGKVNQNRLVIHDGSPITADILDLLLNRSIIPVDVKQLGATDNPQS